MGFHVITANDGEQALEKLHIQNEHRPFHLVLTDHSMPKMTGLELAAQIEKDMPHIPFILLSGYSKEKLQEIMDEYKIVKAVLRKPIAKDALKQQIDMVLLQTYDMADFDNGDEQVA